MESRQELVDDMNWVTNSLTKQKEDNTRVKSVESLPDTKVVKFIDHSSKNKQKSLKVPEKRCSLKVTCGEVGKK